MFRSTLRLFGAAALLCCAPFVSAQSTGTAGTIRGTITDQNGAAVSSATVTASNPVSGFQQTVQSGTDGVFTFSNVPFNHYHVTAEAAGFTRRNSDAEVRSSLPTYVNFSLKIGAAETVTVEAESEDVLRNTPVASSTVDRNLINTLPTESVNAPLSSLVALSTPGIAADSNGLFHPLGEHADTSFSVDGQPITDQQSRVFSNQLPVSAIQSINVINGAVPAEYGDKASLVIQTTTRSGLDTPTPHGSVSFSYGSFGTANGNVSVGFGGKRFGNFVSIDGVDSGRYLDTPEFRPIHDHGNAQNLFDRIDFQSRDGKDALHLNLFASRSWFQQPNQYDQQANGQDERAKILSYDVSPFWTHLFSEHALLSVNPYIRQDNFHFYPSADPFAELPAFLSQSRRLQNVGIKTDFSYSRGIHDVKAGVNWYHTFLHEGFAVGITDPAFNDPAGPGFLPGLAPFDLTRGGSPFVFNGHTDIKQEAFYLQDNINWYHFNFLLGARGDIYNGLSHRNMFEPRIGGSYNIARTGTVLRAAFSRIMMTPYNENLILSSSTGIGGLANNAGAFGVTPLIPARRNQLNAGFEQAFGRHLIVDADYVWKYTDPDFDFDIIFNTPLTFPIQWHKSKIDGLAVRVTMPEWHGVTAYSVLGHTRSRFFGPEVGGIIFNDPTVGTSDLPFRIDHDQAFQQTAHVQYQPKPNGPWFSFNWRYESGLVAGAVPFASDTTTPVDLTGLSPDQQNQIRLTCAGVRATLTSSFSSCAPADLSSSLVRIPAPGTENDDEKPPRIQPRTMFDVATGWDNLFHADRYKMNLSFTVINLTDKLALYNFQSTFSGTHFVTPRTFTGSVSFNF